MRDAPGPGGRSAGDLETGLGDFGDEVAREAAVDGERAIDPLLGLGDDVLVEPLARRLAHRPDQKDRAAIGYREVGHGKKFRRGGMPRHRDPGALAARRVKLNSAVSWESPMGSIGAVRPELVGNPYRELL
jgi:hypothetical protein